MAHCLLARDRATGTVTVLSPATFDRGEDAVDAARALVVSGVVDPGATEILVVDLTGAWRVEFITLASPVDEPVAEDVDLAPAAGVWETPANAPELADRGVEPEPEPVLQPEPEPDSGPELGQTLELLAEPVSAEELLLESPVEPHPEPALRPEPRLEPSPVPVPAAAPLPAMLEEEPATDEPPGEIDDGLPPVKSAAVTEATIVEALPVVELDVGPYEVSGELVLERYTCDECVYANTCPKVGESAPAQCGSFQWKAL
jgi:hypothetical protein